MYIAPTKPPINLEFLSGTPTSLAFTWAAPPCGFRWGIITTYTYQLQNEDGAVLHQREVRDSSIVIRNLKPFQRYQFRVSAQNRDGRGPFTDVLTVYTEQSSKQANCNYNVMFKIYLFMSSFNMYVKPISFETFCITSFTG